MPPEYVVELSHADVDPQLPPVGLDPAAEVVVEVKGGVTIVVVLVEAGEVLVETGVVEVEAGGWGASPETGQESALAAVMNSDPALGY